MTGINELWVINTAGMCIFHHSNDNKSDSDLISGYFAAIDMIIQSQGSKSIGKIMLGKQHLLFSKPNDYPTMFIGKADNTEKEDMLESTLQTIVKNFIENYPKEKVEKWRGDLAAFSGFAKKIAVHFQSAQDRMQQFLM